MAMFDLSSSWVDRAALRAGRPRLLPRRQEGLRPRSSTGCSPTPPGARSRSGCSPATPPTRPRSPDAVDRSVRDTFGLDRDGDGRRPRDDHLRPDRRACNELGGDLGWLTALRAPAIAALAADDGPLQMSLFDEQNLAEITHPDYPGERLVACRNPLLAAERARKRGDCSPPPRPRWPRSSPPSPPGGCAARTRSG